MRRTPSQRARGMPNSPRACADCGEPTLGSLSDGTPVCWRPCYHVRITASPVYVRGPALQEFIEGARYQHPRLVVKG